MVLRPSTPVRRWRCRGRLPQARLARVNRVCNSTSQICRRHRVALRASPEINGDWRRTLSSRCPPTSMFLTGEVGVHVVTVNDYSAPRPERGRGKASGPSGLERPGCRPRRFLPPTARRPTRLIVTLRHE